MRTSLDLEWSKRGWLANGPYFEGLDHSCSHTLKTGPNEIRFSRRPILECYQILNGRILVPFRILQDITM